MLLSIFKRGFVMPETGKPPYHKPLLLSNLPNLISKYADYTPNLPICQTFYGQNMVYKMYKNVQKMYKISRKNIKRFGYFCKNQEKGLKVLYVLILGRFVMIFVIPA